MNWVLRLVPITFLAVKAGILSAECWQVLLSTTLLPSESPIMLVNSLVDRTWLTMGMNRVVPSA